jgi:cytochrome P450
MPRILARLLTKISDTTLSSLITNAEVRNLPYLQAVIKEGLRIWPLAVGLIAKKVLPSGDIINGMYVLNRTMISYGGFSILRNKKIWGDVFCLERWLEGENIKELELTWEVGFNVGRYQCLGRMLH